MKLLYFPDNKLRLIAQYIQDINIDTKYLSIKMLDLMYEFGGIGLAATQIGIHKRIIVIDITSSQNNPLVCINPTIISHSNEQMNSLEGCLSIPQERHNILRYKTIQMKFTTLTHKTMIIKAQHILSSCIQHEIDHLNGILFIDYLSNLKYKRIYDKMYKKQTKKI
ncbi:peptide deformylase [Enterobacteriaceae endosymbiont of Macroplea appendiculata]|uniref:peptide deformylase n=1 Tax=Enterobacteriaceae endosymbiont of Macroplea appendiculata TaxID=2675790 RepID=UPI001448B664|nr:peptide deformylase [Enterobacteriaceae endosymbiont of Macroplea appendiculata]QJC30860.1 peptide deformylase [Enterobacteriaceae endosymbiont of Macroplea appendiculata]